MSQEGIIEFRDQPPNSLRVLSDVVNKVPTLVGHYNELRRKHEPTGDHVMRVTMTMIDVSNNFGLDPHFAGILGLGHDSGKALIPEPPETEMYRGEERRNGAYLNSPMHMENVREIIKGMPVNELSEKDKEDVSAVLMAHHEVMTSPFERYPRGVHEDTRGGIERRGEITEDIFRWQVILALCDKADRAAWGINPDEGFQNNTQVRKDLRNRIDTLKQYDVALGQRLEEMGIDGYIDLIADVTTNAKLGIRDEAKRILAGKDKGERT